MSENYRNRRRRRNESKSERGIERSTGPLAQHELGRSAYLKYGFPVMIYNGTVAGEHPWMIYHETRNHVPNM